VHTSEPVQSLATAHPGIELLTEPALKGKIAIARPSAGTTGGYVAALYVLWGQDRFTSFLQKLHDNEVKLVGGNSVVADMVGSGTLLAGLTDNDDAASALANGGKLRAILPDQAPGAQGTLLIPTTVALVKGSQHAEAARRLIDALLAAETEQQMQAVKFTLGSVRDAPDHLKPMEVDYTAAARALPGVVRQSLQILEGR
jgi:ABC-type Fe3+ transport system substrate-binding protein